MIIPHNIFIEKTGYFAGCEDGIVTAGGEPASRQVDVLDPLTYQHIKRAVSADNGHYLLMGLDPNREYLLIARDCLRQYEPVAYDYIKPANDKTIAEQVELWNEWNN
ncbi:MAG: hypothetical protein CSA10_00580 [Cardiobacteriales bacterium]|nr:MAG: hypothetical protein CSA10_00580 [Cardiobacteriales bacterium]